MSAEWIVEANALAVTLAESFRQGPVVDDFGRRMLAEELVANLDGLKIEIFAKEHPPPHFRVFYAGETANFTIDDCRKINGDLRKWEKNIRDWHVENRQNLIDTWNRTRPDGCPVGPFFDKA